MTDVVASNPTPRNVDIDSAIGHSSFQLPVFVALGAVGGEAQIVKTFATAREVFDHVFSVMLDRLRQRGAVAKVEKLVPASADLKNSANTQYVLFVRGKAIFWFGAAAARRPAGRRLLLEHARQLAEAERAPFYVLSTRARKIRAAALAASLVLIAVLAILIWRLTLHGVPVFHRPASRQAAPAAHGSTDVTDRRLTPAGDVEGSLRERREPDFDGDVATGEALTNEALPEVAIGPVIPPRRPPGISKWREATPGPVEKAYVRHLKFSNPSLPAGNVVPRTDVADVPVQSRRRANKSMPQTGNLATADPKPGTATKVVAPTRLAAQLDRPNADGSTKPGRSAAVPATR